MNPSSPRICPDSGGFITGKEVKHAISSLHLSMWCTTGERQPWARAFVWNIWHITVMFFVLFKLTRFAPWSRQWHFPSPIPFLDYSSSILWATLWMDAWNMIRKVGRACFGGQGTPIPSAGTETGLTVSQIQQVLR